MIDTVDAFTRKLSLVRFGSLQLVFLGLLAVLAVGSVSFRVCHILRG